MLKIFNEIRLKDGKILIIREPEIEDAEKMIEYFNIVGGESDNLLFGRNEFLLGIEQESNHILRIKEEPNSLIVLGVLNGLIVSVGQLITQKRKRISHNADLSISVKKEFWNKGVGSAIMDTLISFARENSTIYNINLGVNSSNTNAIELYGKYGFKSIGIHKNNFFVNGKFDDEVLMDLYLKQI